VCIYAAKELPPLAIHTLPTAALLNIRVRCADAPVTALAVRFRHAATVAEAIDATVVTTRCASANRADSLNQLATSGCADSDTRQCPAELADACQSSQREVWLPHVHIAI
jgi:hypothetical protein